MRSLDLQRGTLRITSVSGKRRDIPVSGFSKARLLWLFRNYYILDFHVLNPKQQRLIARIWNSAAGADAKEVATVKEDAKKAVLRAVDPAADDSAGLAGDLDSLDLIGTVEGYLPQLYAPTAPAQFHVGDPISSPVIAHPHRLRIKISVGVRTPAIWSALAVMAILLLAGMFALGPNILGSAAGSKAPSSTPQPAPLPAAAAAEASPLPAAPIALAHAPAKPSPAIPANAAAASAANASSQPPHPLPAAMAFNAPLPDVTPPGVTPGVTSGLTPDVPPAPASLALRASTPANQPAHRPANREVMIRVSVDRHGRAQQVEILRGDPKKTSAALNAARRFAFEPCHGSFDCDHLLKFTDYGDASIVQKID
jgi:hypothetical protein